MRRFSGPARGRPGPQVAQGHGFETSGAPGAASGGQVGAAVAIESECAAWLGASRSLGLAHRALVTFAGGVQDGGLVLLDALQQLAFLGGVGAERDQKSIMGESRVKKFQHVLLLFFGFVAGVDLFPAPKENNFSSGGAPESSAT
jgi:hypothetical protein